MEVSGYYYHRNLVHLVIYLFFRINQMRIQAKNKHPASRNGISPYTYLLIESTTKKN